MNKGSTVLFINNIDSNVTEDDLSLLFSPMGKITNIRLKYDRETFKPLGFGFIEFEESESVSNN